MVKRNIDIGDDMIKEDVVRERKYNPETGQKIFTVVNPVSANGKTGKLWPEYERSFVRRGINLDVSFTRYSGHAVELVRDALLNGYDRVMVVGGDGTVNEVVNGLFSDGDLINPAAKLIVFSQGTGSDYIRSIGISNNLEEIIQIIYQDKQLLVDVGQITYVTNHGEESQRYFVNLADAGIGGETVHLVNNSSKLLGGLLTYLIGVLRTLINYKNKVFKLTVDGKVVLEKKINSVMVANGKYFAGGMQIAPRAEIEDGLFDIIVLNDLTRLEVVINLYKAYQGKHLSHPKIDMLRGREIILEAEAKVLIDVDGEAVGQLPAKFKILEKKLPVLVL